jgi:uncharacterized protein involved in exopolysaccharide biosynthesis
MPDPTSLYSLFSAYVSTRRLKQLALAAVGSLVVVAALLVSPRKYTATAEFLLQESSTGGSNLASLAAQFGVASPAISGPGAALYAEWLQAFEVVREVAISQYDVKGARPFTGTLKEYFELGDQAGEENAVMMLRRHARPRADRQLNTVRIDVVFPSRELASAVARRYLEVLSAFAEKRRRTVGGNERAFVEGRLAESKDSLRIAEDNLAEFVRANRNYSSSPDLNLRYARFQQRVTQRQGVVQTLLQSYEAARLQEIRDTPVFSLIQRPEFAVEPVARGTALKGVLAFLTLVLLQLGVERVWATRKR